MPRCAAVPATTPPVPGAGRATKVQVTAGRVDRVRRVTARIVLFGATGYTGARTAEALVARGAPARPGRPRPRPAGRAGRPAGRGRDGARRRHRPPVGRAGCSDRGDVLVTTVGPFLQLGRAAVDAAVDAGAVYLDSTGEPPFVRRVLRATTARARPPPGAALIPAFGLDYVPGNLAAALALAEAGDRAHRARRRLQPGRRLGPGLLARHAGLAHGRAVRAGLRLHRRPAGRPRPRAAGSGGSRRTAGPGAGCRSAARSTSRCPGSRRRCARSASTSTGSAR